MLIPKYLISSIITLLLALFSFSSSAAVSNCQIQNSAMPHVFAFFEIDNATTAIPTGQQLARAQLYIYYVTCDFTGANPETNTVYLRNTTDEKIKRLLLDSGVDLLQTMNGSTIQITNPNVRDMRLSSASQGNQMLTATTSFSLRKAAAELKPFDTGIFQLGTHVDYQGKEVGGPFYVRIMSKLTLLCPAPAVDITASNGGTVNFATIVAPAMDAGNAVTRSFNLNLKIGQECQTGINASVRFESNNNNILADKYLDMGNGLQVLLNSNGTDINYNQEYRVGELLPKSPLSIPYTATLTKIAGSTITSGVFSKTVRVVVSY